MGMMRELETKPERFAKNQAGYLYTRSEVLSLLGAAPSIGFKPTRAQVGAAGTPTETFDIVAQLDSTYKALAVAAPTCATEIGQLRQGEVWLALTRRSLDASNANQLDTANYYAGQSMRLSTTSPYPHYVMGNVANSRGDKKAAVAHWKQVISTSGTDTTYKDIRNSSTYFIGLTQLEIASTLQGAERQTTAREAAEAFKALFAATGETQDTPNIIQGMADALKLAGDSAAIASVYAPLLASPDKYNDFTHTMGGVIATQINKLEDARALFEAAVQRNPTARDALRNVAATYYAKNEFTKMFDPLNKLVAIDPNNKDAWEMFAYGYQGLMNATKVPAEKKAFADSLLKYKAYADSMPAKVEVVNFQRGANAGQLVLAVDQQSAKPGTYSITVDFLDMKGAVIASDTQTVGPVTKGKPTQVTFKANGAGMAGYRYKALK
jgi:predicted Zn-dependent protease